MKTAEVGSMPDGAGYQVCKTFRTKARGQYLLANGNSVVSRLGQNACQVDSPDFAW